jgi:hypothetical protein
MLGLKETKDEKEQAKQHAPDKNQRTLSDFLN